MASSLIIANPARSAGIRLVLAILREIFDESAYQRFLVRTGQLDSRVAFIAFQDERAATQAERPRCC